MEDVKEAQILKYIGELIWNTLILIRLANCRVVLYLFAVCVLTVEYKKHDMLCRFKNKQSYSFVLQIN